MSTNKLFVSFGGEERSMEEQVVILSQTVRVLEQLCNDQTDLIENILTRLHFLEANLNTDNN